MLAASRHLQEEGDQKVALFSLFYGATTIGLYYCSHFRQLLHNIPLCLKNFRIFADGKVPRRSSRGLQEVNLQTPTMPKKTQEPAETEAEELDRLREENKRLAEALRASEWMCHVKDVMIDDAEKAVDIPIRIKSGTKQ